MDHDFTEEHKAAGCDGTGIMSYGDPIDEWSECSKKDLHAHYLTQKKNWCMESNFYFIIYITYSSLHSKCAGWNKTYRLENYAKFKNFETLRLFRMILNHI